MSNACSCSTSETMVFACSGGGANVGQIANNAAVELAREGKAKMHCLAGLGGHVPGIVDSTRLAKRIIVIDGCSVACAKKTVEHAGFTIDRYIVVTDEGIEKIPGNYEISQEQLSKIKSLAEIEINS